jgi:membrane-bound ClpP family serine protease
MLPLGARIGCEEDTYLLALGIALMVAGAGLLALEAHVVSYGAIGSAGVAALVGGAVLALGAAGASTAVILAVAVALTALAAASLTFLLRAGLAVTRRQIQSGPEALVGHVGVLRAAPQPLGQVFVDGALWQARASCLHDDGPPLHPGEPVVVERVKGLTLTVRRAEDWEVET